MHIEVKTLHFSFHSQVDPNPIKYKLFHNFNHYISFNARLMSLYAFMRCIFHHDVAPHMFFIRPLFWAPPWDFAALKSEALNSSCQMPTTRILKPYGCYNNIGQTREAIMLYFKKGFKLLSRGRQLQSLKGCLSLAPASFTFELNRQSVLLKGRCKKWGGLGEIIS